MSILIDTRIPAISSTNSETSFESTNKLLRQWVSKVIRFSSQYNDTTWSANQIIGTPKIYPNYGDIEGSWAQNRASAQAVYQFIELEYPDEVYIKEINIYETYHAGAVIRISLKDKLKDIWHIVWENPTGAQDHQTSRIFSPELSKTLFRTNQVRLELNCQIANTWCEIDAVEIVGKKFMVDVIDTEKELRNNLRELLFSEEFSDIQFEVQGRIVKAHRNILTSRSEHFKTLLSELRPDRLARPIHVENITFEGFRALIYYLYTNEIDSSTKLEIVGELIRVSDWYNLEELKTAGNIFLQDYLSVENVIGLFVCASTIEPFLEDIEKMCLKFIAKNFQSLYIRPEFKQLSQNLLVKITQFYGQFQ